MITWLHIQRTSLLISYFPILMIRSNRIWSVFFILSLSCLILFFTYFFFLLILISSPHVLIWGLWYIDRLKYVSWICFFPFLYFYSNFPLHHRFRWFLLFYFDCYSTLFWFLVFSTVLFFPPYHVWFPFRWIESLDVLDLFVLSKIKTCTYEAKMIKITNISPQKKFKN